MKKLVSILLGLSMALGSMTLSLAAPQDQGTQQQGPRTGKGKGKRKNKGAGKRKRHGKGKQHRTKPQKPAQL